MRQDATPVNLDPTPVLSPATVVADHGMTTVSHWLGQLEESSSSSEVVIGLDHPLLHVRLGLANSLFTALRAKHPPSAEHSLRVAIICSNWAEFVNLPSSERDELEVAALLHDVGKIGVPDTILRKPSALTPDQTLIAQRAREYGVQILACCVPDSVLRIVAYAGAWYNGSRTEMVGTGGEIPYASRLIHIADAFDAMTVDSVYRRAISMDLAIAELFASAGTQFDPELVAQFAAAHAANGIRSRSVVEHRWLRSLTADSSNSLWQLRLPSIAGQRGRNELMSFHDQLFHGVRDIIFFLDVQGVITHWNRGAESTTGISSVAMQQQSWRPEILRLRLSDGSAIGEEACPILAALHHTLPSSARLQISARDWDALPVDAHMLPVSSPSGQRLGTVVVMRDTSNQSVLEARVKTLHEQSITDPLTGVANRAHFDRAHDDAVRRHLSDGKPYSLIICDIDRFKSINDRFGHQAGDEAIVRFAKILRSGCRSGDTVARYGGEEFVIICPGCGIGEAAALAEKIRLQLSQTALRELEGQCITASFGVTELQPGDSPETILRRADRGLLRAKDTGRNRVVQLGVGMMPAKSTHQVDSWWTRWLPRRKANSLLECQLKTNVPLPMTVEKLRGFIADHDADIVSIQGQLVTLRIDAERVIHQRRQSDRSTPFEVRLDMEEFQPAKAEGPSLFGTRVNVAIQALRDRDRRTDPIRTARTLLASLKAYLMAQEL